jgi:hypothetical protein
VQVLWLLAPWSNAHDDYTKMMNDTTRDWLVAYRGLKGLRRDWPLILLGGAMLFAYHWFGGHRWWMAGLLMAAPMLVKLVVAVFIVGWRKALIPQNWEHTRIFLPWRTR